MTIKPEDIPQFTGDLGQLEQHTSALRKEADGIRRAGAAAHTSFQGLSAFYQAPEADDLFASTTPVRDRADGFADKVATVAEALTTYAVEVTPIIARLKRLQTEAVTFVAGLKNGSGAFDEDWTDDQDKVDENQALMNDVAAAQAAFTAAEIACNNKITALVGGTQYVIGTGDKQFLPLGAEIYGYSAEVLQQAKELPWGTPVSKSHDWWDPKDFGYYAKSFVWDGLIVDNVWGTVDGLATLAGVHGGDAAGDAWEGLTRAIVGAETYLMESGGQQPTGFLASDFAQESKVYAKEFGKSFVAWDMWQENPARAAATVVFNGLTLGVGPLKAASAGKAGAGARAAATAARVGEIIDPISAAAKVTHALPRIAEVTANLRGLNNVPDLRAPHSVLELSDGSRVRIENGEFIRVDDAGRAISDTPRHEPAADTRAEQPEATPPRRNLAEVGATSRAPGATAHAGENLPPQASREVPTGGGSSAAPHGPGGTGAGHAADSGASASDAGRVGDGHANAGSGAPDVPGQRGGSVDNGGTGGRGGGATGRQDIMRHQVDRANNEPGYFEKYYKKNGNRLSTKLADESGLVPPQLVKDPATGKWISASDAPPPLLEKYLGDPIKVGRGTASPEALKALDGAARTRHSAIAADQLAENHLKSAREALETHKTQANQAAADAADAAHKPLHRDMSESSEAYGETIAEHHVIPERYPNAERMELDGPANGNDQFDQVWRREDGGYVVIEAKSSTSTKLGARNLPNGMRVSQGTREYFDDILSEMRVRGRRNPNELRLALELKKALKSGKLDYVLVKGNPNNGHYAGYTMEKFDIGGGRTA
ncbi:hypothetical protein [Streptomyces phaeochromogenes]